MNSNTIQIGDICIFPRFIGFYDDLYDCYYVTCFYSARGEDKELFLCYDINHVNNDVEKFYFYCFYNLENKQTCYVHENLLHNSIEILC